MSFINWTDQELTNIKLIDEQHRETTNLINEMYENRTKNSKRTQIKFIEKLVIHLREHFETEERFMKEYADIGYISHKLEHERLLNKVIMTERKLKDEDSFLADEFFQSMRKWFYNHLDFKDSKLAKHLVEKGVK